MVGKLSKQIDYKININDQILTVLNLKITMNFDQNIHSTYEPKFPLTLSFDNAEVKREY